MVDELEVVMQQRAIPKAPRDLADRIIALALEQPQTKIRQAASDGWSWLQEFFDNFLIPRPQWAFGVVLALGIVVGMNIGQPANAAQDLGLQEIAAVLDIENNFNLRGSL